MQELSAHPVLLVMALAVAAALLAEIPIGIRIPVGVIQLVLGIVAGPHVLALAKPEGILAVLGFFGTCALFFMAGLELDLDRVKGRPSRLAVMGWVVSLALGLLFATVLHVLPIIRTPIFVAIALTTTALGMLMPILRDAGELATPFGRYVLAAGAAGEFGPVVVMSLVFARDFSRWQEAGLMLLFVALAVGCALVAFGMRPPRILAFLEAGMHKSAQLPVLLAMLLLSAFTVLAEGFGLEALLGAFAAGMVIGLATRGEAGGKMRAKIEAIMFGFFVPFFYVVSGMRFDLTALLGSAKAQLLMPLFLLLMVLSRGVPVALYRNDLARNERASLVLYTSMGLPILIAVTHIGVETGRMSSEIASALIGAGVISVLMFPALALRLRAGARELPGRSGLRDQEGDQ
jgi:Kef-type K+ transport system membrane component KefB